jgi:hypothetical protein
MFSFGNLFDGVANALLDHIRGKASYTMPANYQALSTTIPNNNGTNITEPSGGSYARKLVQGTDLNAAASRIGDNVNELAFATATADWGEILAWVQFDADVAGNPIMWGLLGSIKTTLNEHLTHDDTTITLADASGLPAAGTIIIGKERITYTGKSVNNLTGCTRGAGGSTATAHETGSYIFLVQSVTINNGSTFKFPANALKARIPA